MGTRPPLRGFRAKFQRKNKMMGPAGFLIAIMGCGEAEAQCQQVQLVPARYETEAACLAASGDQLARHSDLEFPVVVAQCRAVGAQPASLRSNEVRLPEPKLPRMRVASRR
jgi:hypothetical protein